MLADDFFRVAHNDVTGRPRLSARVLALGLAAGLLGELVSARHVNVVPDLSGADALALGPAGWPPDQALYRLCGELASERLPRPIRVWLSYLSETAYERVGTRLAAAGGVGVRRRWRRLVYVPVDMNAAAGPAAVLSQKLRRGLPLDYNDACLSGLVAATGLDRFLLDGAPPAARDRLHRSVRQLWPPMRRLVEHTEAAVGDAVLSHRS